MCKQSKLKHNTYLSLKENTSPEEKLIFSLLENNINQAGYLIKTNKVDFSRFISLIERHKIMPLIFKRFLSIPIARDYAPYIYNQSEKIITATAVIHTHIKQKLYMLAELFYQNNIEFMLLKGYSVDKSPLRQMDDLDVLIHWKDIDTVFTVLESSGYTYVGSFILSPKEKNNPQKQYKWNNQYQFQVPESQLVVEVHTNLFERDRIHTEKLNTLLDNVKFFWDKRTWDSSLNCYTPAKEATLALLCMHSAIKYYPAAKIYILRQSYDIYNLLRQEVEESYFLQLCDAWHIEYYVYFSLMLTAKIFQDRSIEQTACKLKYNLNNAERFLAYIHLKCYKNLEKTLFFYRKLYALCMPFIIGDGFLKAVRWYKEQIFPPVWLQERKFGIKRTSPLLYLTYIYGPLQRIFTALKKQIHIQQRK